MRSSSSIFNPPIDRSSGLMPGGTTWSGMPPRRSSGAGPDRGRGCACITPNTISVSDSPATRRSKYLDSVPSITLRAGDRVLGRLVPSDQFVWDVAVPPMLSRAARVS